MTEAPHYKSQVLDHLGLVAGMFDELGIGEIIDCATQQDPLKRDLTVGEAVKAMVLNGLGFVNHALYLVPQFCHNKPTRQLISLNVSAAQLNDDALGRALDTLYTYGVTELYSLIAARAAQRLGSRPLMLTLTQPAFMSMGATTAMNPAPEGVVRLTKGYSRDHRPDLNQVILELIVKNQAGIPLLMKPLSGNRNDTPEFGQIVQDHVAQLHSTYGTTYLVADSALYSEGNLALLQDTPTKWITRVPATLSEVKAALAQVCPEDLTPLKAGYCYQSLTSSYGGVDQRWLLINSESRRPQATRTVSKRWLKPGRPKSDNTPSEMGYVIQGAVVSRLSTYQQEVEQASCFVLATNELDESCLSPLELLDAYKGQQHAERGFRFLKHPEFLAASLYLKKPERIMALLMVMTVCLLIRCLGASHPLCPA